MPTYSEIGAALADVAPPEHLLWLAENLRQVLQRMEERTGRPVVIYEANHRTQQLGPGATLMDVKDLESFMDVLRGVCDGNLDLIINSYGGSPDAADMIGAYLRQKFGHIRVFVPVEAMSAATMLACSAHEVVMGKHSFLGPIDLQFAADGGESVYAVQDLLEQFQKVRGDFPDNASEFWQGPGAKYWPDLLVRCENALAYGKEVAERGLSEGMFLGHPDADARAGDVAKDLADHQKHRAHGRRLSRSYLRKIGMNVGDLEADQELQDAVLTTHHLTSHLFETIVGATKILVSSRGRLIVELAEAVYGPNVVGTKHRTLQHLLYQEFQSKASAVDGPDDDSDEAAFPPAAAQEPEGSS